MHTELLINLYLADVFEYGHNWVTPNLSVEKDYYWYNETVFGIYISYNDSWFTCWNISLAARRRVANTPRLHPYFRQAF